MSEALLGVYRPAEPVFVRGHGVWLVAEDGREYLDFVSGIAVNALGYGNAGVAQAITQAVGTGLIHVSNLYRTRPVRLLAEDLVRLTFADQVFFCNSGAEANEAAFKFARRWAMQDGAREKHEIVAVRGSFHGRLFGSLAATDRAQYREPFEPLMAGVRFVRPGDEAAAREAISQERTAAIIVEPIQGEGGVLPLPAAYLGLLRSLADEAGAALIFDEVQVGLGRTGSFLAHEQFGVTPDLLTLAKPLAGGLPMGAVLMTEEIARAMKPGDHGTTFGGGPLVSAAAREVVARVSEPVFLENVRARGAQIYDSLEPLVGRGVVRALRGRGLIWGIELETEAAPVVARALEAGLLVTVAGERVVRLLPPLVIGEAELARGLEILRGALP